MSSCISRASERASRLDRCYMAPTTTTTDTRKVRRRRRQLRQRRQRRRRRDRRTSVGSDGQQCTCGMASEQTEGSRRPCTVPAGRVLCCVHTARAAAIQRSTSVSHRGTRVLQIRPFSFAGACSCDRSKVAPTPFNCFSVDLGSYFAHVTGYRAAKRYAPTMAVGRHHIDALSECF